MRLTPEQIEAVDIEMLDLANQTQYEVAEALGIEPLPNGKWSEQEMMCLRDEPQAGERGSPASCPNPITRIDPRLASAPRC